MSNKKSGITRSVINSTLHAGGLYEIYNVTPVTLAVRRAGAKRVKDLDRGINRDKGFYQYMEDEGFGDKHYILSKPAQTAIARIASSESHKDKNKHPYGYYIRKHQGFI